MKNSRNNASHVARNRAKPIGNAPFSRTYGGQGGRRWWWCGGETGGCIASDGQTEGQAGHEGVIHAEQVLKSD